MVKSFRRAAIVLGLAAGCAGTGWTALNGAALRASGPKSISVAVGPSATFRTPHNFAGALLPALANYAADSAAYKERLGEPSKNLGDQLALLLARKFGLEVWSEGRADLTLHVSTVDWGLECTALTDGCTVLYRASLQLKDNRSGRILSSGECEKNGEILASTSPGENRRAVNLGLEAATHECVDVYRTKMFSIFKSDLQKTSPRPASAPPPHGPADGGLSPDARPD